MFIVIQHAGDGCGESMREAVTGLSADTGLCNDAAALSPSLGELTALALLGTPCCGHIALCDRLCRDALPAMVDMRRPAGAEPR